MESVDKIEEARIYNLGDLVAMARLPLYSTIEPFFPDADKIDLYYFKTISLKSYIVYEHMAGQSLSHYLDGSDVILEKPGSVDRLINDLKYIHGRSETMRGKQTVSSVLLAKLRFTRPVPDPAWIRHIPEIYRRYMLLSDADKIST